MTAKEWLSRARRLDAELESAQQARDRMVAVLTKGTQNLTGDVVQSSPDPHNFDRLGELAADVEARKRELDHVKAEVFRAINRVPDTLCRIVLIERYLNCKSFELLAVENHFSIRNVWRIHGRALDYIDELKPWE